MKKFFISSMAFLFITLCTTHVIAGEIIFMNANKFPIATLRLTNISSGQGYSLLNVPLAAQEALKVRLDDDGLWNLMAVDLNGSAVHFENIRLQDFQQIHIFGNGTLEVYK